MLKRLVSMLLCLALLLPLCPRGFAETVEAEAPAEETAAPARLEEETEPVPEFSETEPEPFEETEPETVPLEEETVPAEEPEEALSQAEPEPWSGEEEPLPAADGYLASGQLDGGVSWSLAENGVLTVSGSGAIPNYHWDEQKVPWRDFREHIFAIWVQDGITGIGNDAFSGCSRLETVQLGADVSRIGEGAFSNCTSLTAFTFPEGIEYVERDVLSGCTALASVTIPEGVRQISPGAFSGCSALKSLRLPDSLESICSGAFENCTGLDSLEIPEKVSKIGEDAFRGCGALSRVSLPEGLSQLGMRAFAECGKLASVAIPGGITAIPEACFRNCTGLSEVTLPDSLRRMENNAFENCPSLQQIVLPQGLLGLGSGVFWKCTGLTAIELPANVTVLENGLFEGCTGLRRVSNLENVTKIGSGAFSGCASLEGPVHLDRIEAISDYAFENCKSLTEVRLGEKLTAIERGTFFGCEKLEQAALPQDLLKIGREAFQGCESLQSIRLPNQLKEIGQEAFSGCLALREMTLPDGVETIGESAFFICGKLEDLHLPESVQSIGRNAFQGCGDVSCIRLEGLPEYLREETVLNEAVPLPELLKKASGGQAELAWALQQVPEEMTAMSQIAELEHANGVYTLRPKGPGKFCLVCQDSYTGLRNSRVLEVEFRLEIRPAEEITLVSGEEILLSAVSLPGEDKWAVQWLLEGEDAKAAAITPEGCLRAKPVAKAQTVTVTAKLPSGASAQKTVTVLPRATAVGFALDGRIVSGSAEADMAKSQTLRLTARIQPEDAKQDVVWYSEDEQIAAVSEDGSVTLLKPGRVLIGAQCRDGSGTAGRLALNVYYLDAAETLTLTSSAQSLEAGTWAQLTLAGEDPIDARKVSFTVSDAEKAAVDEAGRITAGDTPGTVTVVAALKGDPLLRTAQVKLRILEGPVRTLKLEPVLPDDLGYTEDGAEGPMLCIEAGKLGWRPYTFRLKTWGSRRAEVWQELPGITYGTSNAYLASIGADGTVTVRAGAEGSCRLTAKTPEGLETCLNLTVRDSSPRLEQTYLTVNSYREQGVSTGLVESYGNEILELSLHDYDWSTRNYLPEPSGKFRAVYVDGTLEVEPLDVLNYGIYNTQLQVVCKRGTFSYTLQMWAVNSLPQVDIRQTASLNLFYQDASAPLTVAAPGNEIRSVELTGTDSFRLAYYPDGTASLLPGERESRVNPVGTLKVYLEGWRRPVERVLYIAAENRAPWLTVNPASRTIDPTWDPTVSVQLYSGKNPVDLTGAEVACTSGNGELTAQGENLIFRLTNQTGGLVRFTLRMPDWAQAQQYAFWVLADRRPPTLQLQTSYLKLNSRMPWQTAQTQVSLSQSNRTLGGITFAPLAAEGSALWTEARKLRLTFDPQTGTVQSSIGEGETPRPGNYLFVLRGSLPDGTELAAVYLTVSVTETVPWVWLSAGGIWMNRLLAGAEAARITVTTSDPAYRVVGFRELEDYEELRYEAGILTARLTEDSKTTVFRLTPILEDRESGQCLVSPNSLSLSMLLYSTDRLSVLFSARGRLDTQDPENGMTYTVNGLSGCLSDVESVALEGKDADRFRLETEVVGGKTTMRVKLQPWQTYHTGTVYQIRFRFRVCGREVLSPVQWLLVTQSALRVTPPARLNYYLGQGTALKCSLTYSAPVESIGLNSRTDKTFLEALGGESQMEVRGNQILFHLANPEKLTAGRAYLICLDAVPEHNAENLPPTPVYLFLWVQK